MITRLKKLIRWWKGTEEFSFTEEERFIFTHVLRIISNPNTIDWKSGVKPFEKINLVVWESLMANKDRPATLFEQNLDVVMKDVAQKLLKQQDYD